MVVAKKKVGFWIDEEIADQLDGLSEKFDGLKGELVAAALTMYIAAGAEDKAAALKKVLGEKVDRAFLGPQKLHGGAKRSAQK